jgi:ribonuclease E
MKRIVVSVDPFEARAALLEGDRLQNIEIESAAAGKRKGNVYKGRVTSVEPSLGAAFVDYGASKDGFLPFDEVSSRALQATTGHGRAGSRAGVSRGDWVMVQVSKEEFGKKGASLTTHVALPGRFVVLMPFSDRTGISRKLGGEERARLKQLASRLTYPDGYGVIVRTVGEQEQFADLQTDLDLLVAAWEEVLAKFKAQHGPGELHADAGLAVRFLRDYMTSDVGEVWVEDEPSFRDITRFFEARMPQRRSILKRYDGDVPLFVKYGVERQIESLLNDRVALPSGGSIVIGQTEALVAIDVNSGKFKQRDVEDTAFRVNLEAAKEIARQVVLRDLGGIVVVDFIDMEDGNRRRQVEDALETALAGDKARLSFGKIGEFGLMAFSRQRLRQSVGSGSTTACPTCSGTGRIRTPALLAMSTLRKVRERLAGQGTRAAYVEVRVPVEVANFLNNRKREALVELESRYDIIIDVTGDAEAKPTDATVSVLPEVPRDRTAFRHYDEDAAGEDEGTEESREATPVAAPAHDATGDAEAAGREGGFIKGLLKKFLGYQEGMEEEAGGRSARPEPVAAFVPPRPIPVTPLAPEDRKPRGKRGQPKAQEARVQPAKQPSRPPAKRGPSAVQQPLPLAIESDRPEPEPPAVPSSAEAQPGRRKRHRGGRGRRGRGGAQQVTATVAPAPVTPATAAPVTVTAPEASPAPSIEIPEPAREGEAPAAKKRRRRGGRGRRGRGGAQGAQQQPGGPSGDL